VSGEPLSVLEVDMVGKVCSYVVVEGSSCENVRLEVGGASKQILLGFGLGVRCLRAAAICYFTDEERVTS
jgi:hypothetical protein